MLDSLRAPGDQRQYFLGTNYDPAVTGFGVRLPGR
jgi:hypothetical protein